MIKKGLLIIVGLIAVLLISLIILLNTGPSLPPEADAAIKEAMQSKVPELVTGNTGYSKNGDVDIWYEYRDPVTPSKGSILLIAGALSSAMLWPDYLIEPFVSAGYQVIRYDHRGLGMSNWLADWNKDNPYTLEHMAKDAIAVLDALEVNKAHVIGVSMGGMIAQRMAISHADRILSLTSISSSGYMEDPELLDQTKDLRLDFLRLFLKYGISQSEEDTIKLTVGFIQLLMAEGADDLDFKDIAENVLYETRKRRGYNPKIWDQHTTAISLSGSRYQELPTIGVPTLIIHGTADQAIPISHAKIYAELIPDAKTLWLEGVGHIIPKTYNNQVIEAVLNNIKNSAG